MVAGRQEPFCGNGVGENAWAALAGRGLAKMARLVVTPGGRPDTVASLAGIGDLRPTTTGVGSRNHRVGVALGRGDQGDALLAGTSDEVAERVDTAPRLVARADREGIDVPITRAIVELLPDGWT